MAAELKAKFEGKWTNVNSENFKEYLEKAGIGMIKRNIVLQLTPTMVISVEGETITVSISAGPKTTDVSFKLGEEYETKGETPGKGVTTMVDGDMNTVMTPNDKKLKPHTIVRSIEGGQLVQVIETWSLARTLLNFANGRFPFHFRLFCRHFRDFRIKKNEKERPQVKSMVRQHEECRLAWFFTIGSAFSIPGQAYKMKMTVDGVTAKRFFKKS